MTRTEDSREIKADPEKLSQYLMEVDNLPHYLPISDVQVLETTDEGAKFRHKMTAAGRTIETVCEMKTVEKNKKLTFRTLEGMKVEGTWLLEPMDDGTRLSIIVEYEPPGGIFAWLVDALGMKKELTKVYSESLHKLAGIMGE